MTRTTFLLKHAVLSIMMIIGVFVVGTADLNAQSKDEEMNRILAYMQRAMRFNQAAPQEKVYLHFDNTGYFKGETIRFKAYVKRMDSDQPSNISTVLYVELVNPIGDVCERRTLKVEKGMADGDILLDSIVGGSGFYEVRAFTRYMSNWGTPAAFSRVFPIFNKPKTEGNYTNAVIDKVSFRHRLPNTRVDENGKVAESTTDMAMNSVKFYPEGGGLVNGLKSRVAFSVTSKDGKHVATKGNLLNAQKQKIGTVETDESGRGVFEVVPKSASEALFVQLPDEKGKMKEYQLPDAQQEGCVLTLDMMDDTEITASIHASAGVQGRLLGYVLMHNGSILECDTMTAQPSMVKRFDKLSLPGGVSQFTLFSSEGRILAERLFFLMPFASESDSIYVTTALRSLSPCCKVELDLQAAPNSSISFSAMDAATMTNGKEGNMKTWMLLSSEVSGYIDSPDYYFESDDVAHRRAADLLMMTQGWRRYDWQLMSGQKVLEKVEPIVRMVAKASEKGLRPDGSMIHEANLTTGHVDDDLHWWVQAENVVGWFNLYQHFGDEQALQRAVQCWEYIKTQLIDWEHGEWHWSRHSDGSLNTVDDKAGFWKCPYHNSRMCLEIIERSEGL